MVDVIESVAQEAPQSANPQHGQVQRDSRVTSNGPPGLETYDAELIKGAGNLVACAR
jgi:hypothetical protein